MIIKVNCKYNEKDTICCTNKNIKRSLFGIGARMCIKFQSVTKCEFEEYKTLRPNFPHRGIDRKVINRSKKINKILKNLEYEN